MHKKIFLFIVFLFLVCSPAVVSAAGGSVIRADLIEAVIAARAINVLSDDYENCFVDIKGEDYEQKVCYAKKKGWLKGLETSFPGGKFKPTAKVSASEALAVINRAFKTYTIDADTIAPGRITYDELEDMIAQATGTAINVGVYVPKYRESYYYETSWQNTRVPPGYPQPWPETTFSQSGSYFGYYPISTYVFDSPSMVRLDQPAVSTNTSSVYIFTPPTQPSVPIGTMQIPCTDLVIDPVGFSLALGTTTFTATVNPSNFNGTISWDHIVERTVIDRKSGYSVTFGNLSSDSVVIANAWPATLKGTCTRQALPQVVTQNDSGTTVAVLF